MLNRSLIYTIAGALGITVAIFSFVDERPLYAVLVPGILGLILVIAGIRRRRP